MLITSKFMSVCLPFNHMHCFQAIKPFKAVEFKSLLNQWEKGNNSTMFSKVVPYPGIDLPKPKAQELSTMLNASLCVMSIKTNGFKVFCQHVILIGSVSAMLQKGLHD